MIVEKVIISISVSQVNSVTGNMSHCVVLGMEIDFAVNNIDCALALFNIIKMPIR